MKKLFIGLLIIAAGAGIFYFLRKQNKSLTKIDIQRDWIIGNWKLDSIDMGKDSGDINILTLLDSNLYEYRYQFTADSTVYVSLKDSLTADSSRYAWGEQNELVFQNDLFNKAPDSLNVTMLSKDRLVLQDRDSVLLFFAKAK